MEKEYDGTQNIVLIGGVTKEFDILISYMKKSSIEFGIKAVFLKDMKKKEMIEIACPIVDFAELVNVAVTGDELFVIESAMFENVLQILQKRGISQERILRIPQWAGQIPGAEKLLYLGCSIKELHQASYVNKQIEAGAFTYGTPTINLYAEKEHVKIGKFCSIGQKVCIMAGGEHQPSFATTYPFNAFLPEFTGIDHPTSKGPVEIGNDVWFGQCSTVLSGVTVGDGAVIGYGSVVTHDVPPYAIVAGNPAKLIRYRFEKPVIEKFLEIKWWDWSYERIYEVIPLLQSKNYPALFRYYEKYAEAIENER